VDTLALIATVGVAAWYFWLRPSLLRHKI